MVFIRILDYFTLTILVRAGAINYGRYTTVEKLGSLR